MIEDEWKREPDGNDDQVREQMQIQVSEIWV